MDLLIGHTYQLINTKDPKFMFTTGFSDPKTNKVIKDAVIKPYSKDDDGDVFAYAYFPDRQDTIINPDHNVLIIRSEFDLFKEVGSGDQSQPEVDGIEEGQVFSHDLKKMFQEMVDNNLSSEEMQSKITETIREVVLEQAPRPLEVKFAEKTTVIGTAHAKLEEALKRINATQNIMLVGPAGSGKTYLAAQLAESLQLDFSSISCSSGMSESVITGWLLPVDGGAFEYHESDFIRIYENGGVFLFDEMDAADPSILLIINQALANGKITVPQRKGNTEVKRHKDFICVGACNTFGRGSNLMYSGRERLDESTLDRFRLGLMEMDYDKLLEEKVVDKSVRDWAWQVRARIEESGLRRVMSTRFMIDATKLLQNTDSTMKDVKEIFFVGWKEDERRKVDH